ncbi:MAG TPA: selenocysteine-specific translation elongation factor [Gemmatimonadales bacterium]|nr:selenocysteine-specific translation elongation factor [Gemmatimonadales bacterium]
MIIGTAGHIDHGKSALVEALTGRRVDRLAEERARGITIDLNFAPLALEHGVIAGMVDVPGHEDFVRTMVAGAGGVDLVLLVVAADEGVMRQTREHLAIVEALGIRRGIPVLTKVDLVDPDWLALVEEEVTGWLSSSPVQFGPVIRSSVRSGAGLELLRERLRSEAAKLEPRDETSSFRMPVDRAFSMAGSGTVVTGSVWSGSLEVGGQVRLLPSSRPARVRTIEVHGSPRERASAGHRAALGLVGIDRDAVRRGDVVVDDGLPWRATSALDVRIHLLPEAPRPLTSRTRVHLHLGTAEVVARVLPRAPIPPGGRGMARLSCEAPLVAAGGDRFVIRSYSPVATIGGGTVLDPLPPRRRAQWPVELESPVLPERIRALVSRHPPGVTTASLALATGVALRTVERAAGEDSSLRSLAGAWVTTDQVNAAREKSLEVVRVYHETHPSLPGMSLETLRRRVDRSDLVSEAAVEEAIASGLLEVEGGVARLPAFEPRIAGGMAAVERVVDAVVTAGLAAPGLQELERRLERVDVGGALRLAAGAGRVEAVTADWYVGREALSEFRTLLLEAGKGGEITVAGVRERTGLTRKHLIPLLEWADRQGITRRVGEVRRLT